MIELTDEERAFLELAPRCKCGHLKALHNGHCCSYCLVCEELGKYGALASKFPARDEPCKEGPDF